MFLAWAETHGGSASDVVGFVEDIEKGDTMSFAAYVTKLKVLLAFYQIISSLPGVFGVNLALPVGYGTMTRWVGIATGINVAATLPLRCLVENLSHEEWYLRSLVGTLVGPIVSGAAVFTAYVIHAVLAGEPRRTRHKRRRICTQIVLLFVHVVVPICAYAAVSALVVDGYDYGDGDERRYLRVAPGVSAETAFYKRHVRVWGVLGLALYPLGVPLSYCCLLYRYRHVLNPVAFVPLPGAEKLTALERARALSALDYQLALVAHRDRRFNAKGGGFAQSFEFLWVDYEPQYFYWEVPEVLRRLFFTTLLAIVAPDSRLQVALGLAVSFVHTAGYVDARPFLDDDDDFLATTSGWSVTATLFACLLLRARIGLHASDWRTTAILGVAALLPALAFFYVLRRAASSIARTLKRAEASLETTLSDLQRGDWAQTSKALESFVSPKRREAEAKEDAPAAAESVTVSIEEVVEELFKRDEDSELHLGDELQKDDGSWSDYGDDEEGEETDAALIDRAAMTPDRGRSARLRDVS